MHSNLILFSLLSWLLKTQVPALAWNVRSHGFLFTFIVSLTVQSRTRHGRRNKTGRAEPGLLSSLWELFLFFRWGPQLSGHPANLCTLVLSTLSMCEVQLSDASMITFQREEILTEEKKILGKNVLEKYGKETHILLYFDRIIFIKIYIHVQMPVSFCVWFYLSSHSVATCAPRAPYEPLVFSCLCERQSI